MPYKLHRWEVDSDGSDPGWPRRYVTYDYKTDCSACHEPNGFLRILHHLFGGPATRCRHHRGRNDKVGWGGSIIGWSRRKGCKNPKHHALAFRQRVDISEFPEKVPVGSRNIRIRLPEKCRHHTPGWYRPIHICPELNCRGHHHRRRHTSPTGCSYQGDSPEYYDDQQVIADDMPANPVGPPPPPPPPPLDHNARVVPEPMHIRHDTQERVNGHRNHPQREENRRFRTRCRDPWCPDMAELPHHYHY